MKNILITGGTGNIGATVVQRLLQEGYTIRLIGRRERVEVSEGVEYRQCDVSDFDALQKQVNGCDAIVHMAAVARPDTCPPQDVYGPNACGAFNIFQAAANAGIKRVVVTSSLNSLGCYFSIDGPHLDYFPVDEEHPTHTTDPYSFSKNVVEETGRYFHRRYGITSAFLRIPATYSHKKWNQSLFEEVCKDMRKRIAGLIALPAAERSAKLQAFRKHQAALRRLRVFQPGQSSDEYFASHPELDETDRFIIDECDNLWTRLDDRDCAQSIARALLADFQGSEVFFINEKHNIVCADVAELCGLFYPEVTDFNPSFSGSAGLVSIAKAERLLGYKPEHPYAP